MRIVLPSEANFFLSYREQSMIRDSNAVSVTRQVLQDMFGSAKGRLGIDDPILPEQGTQESRKCFLIRQRQTDPTTDKPVSLKSLP